MEYRLPRGRGQHDLSASATATSTPSPRAHTLGQSPRLITTPSLSNRRKDSTTQSPYPLSPNPTRLGAWYERWFGVKAGQALPFYRRTFLDAIRSPVPYPTEPGAVRLCLDLLMPPVHAMRRSFLVYFALISLLIAAYLLLTPSSHSQHVKLRVHDAFGPYVPSRAANAVRWPGYVKSGKGAASGIVGLRPKNELRKLPPPRRDGRTPIVEGAPHPIPALMEQAKQRWAEKKARQSRTFVEAVAEYERRYKRRPPKGFDQWYAFAKANHVLLIDEFDLINEDLDLYRAFTPSTVRQRVEHLLQTFDQNWSLRIVKGKAYRMGELAQHDRAKGIQKLIRRFLHSLPDMQIAFSGHDSARIPIIWEERQRLEALVAVGDTDSSDHGPPFKPIERGPSPYYGQGLFCPDGTAVKESGFEYGAAPLNSTGLEMPPLLDDSIGALIENFDAALSVCNSPHWRHFHSTTSYAYSQHPVPIAPLFTPGVQATFGDVYTIITEQLELEVKNDVAWEHRPFTSLQWRGQTSGPYWESTMAWQSTHRARLHLLSHQDEGTRSIAVTDEEDVVRRVEVDVAEVNPLFLDVGMVGPAVQCKEDDGTCAKMDEVFQGYDKRITFDRASLYKYVLDVDGNSWSGRFRRLLMSNAAVVKATIFREFWTDWTEPWLHFIPMQVDYSDMWDIMAFFRGGLNGEGAHDALGKEIAEAGKEFVRLCYRWEDLEAYQYRLLLEYARIYNDDEGDYDGDVSQEPIWRQA